jgi:hypothetical protein
MRNGFDLLPTGHSYHWLKQVQQILQRPFQTQKKKYFGSRAGQNVWFHCSEEKLL